jgi:CRP-like cAMP-binding protein
MTTKSRSTWAREALGPTPDLALRSLAAAEPANPAWRVLAASAPGSARALEHGLFEAALDAERPLLALSVALATGRGPDSTAAAMSEWLDMDASMSTTRSAPPLPPAADAEIPAATTETIIGPWVPRGPGPRGPMPLLSRIDEAALVALWPHLALRVLAPGDVLLAEGDAADALFLVVHGVFEVSKSDPDRPDVVLGRVAEGGVLGEMALVLRKPRSATARALGEAVVLSVRVDGLEAVGRAQPLVAAALETFTRQRVVQMLLSTSPLFRDLEPPARAALLQAFQLREIPQGAVVTKQGGEGRALRVVLHGNVEVWRADSPDEAPARVAQLGPGEVFGEIALLTGQSATATVRATVPVTVLELQRATLDTLCAQFPAIADRLRETAEARLAENRFIFQDDDFFEDAE